MTASEHVDVEMVYGLATVRAGVDYDTIAIGQTLLASNCSGRGKKLAEQLGVTAGRMRNAGDMLARDDEKVGRCLGVDVRERNAMFVLIHELDRNGSRDNFAKQAVHIGISVQDRILRGGQLCGIVNHPNGRAVNALIPEATCIFHFPQSF